MRVRGGFRITDQSLQEQSVFHDTVASLIHSQNHNCPLGKLDMTVVFCSASWLITNQRLVIHGNGNRRIDMRAPSGIQSKSFHSHPAMSILNNASPYTSVAVPE